MKTRTNDSAVADISRKMKSMLEVRKPEKMTDIECPASIEVNNDTQTLIYHFPVEICYYVFSVQFLWTIAEMTPQLENEEKIIAFCLYGQTTSMVTPDMVSLKEMCVITIPLSLKRKLAQMKISVIRGGLKTTYQELSLISSFGRMTEEILKKL